MINKDNYEAYFLDYIEGNLSPKDIDMLLQFLEVNPNLEEQLADYSDIPLNAPKHTFDKNSLKQVDFINDEINNSNFDQFAIANLEQTLTKSKTDELLVLADNDKTLSNSLLLITKTKLAPKRDIYFENKSELKKSIPLFIHYYRIAGVAALIIFVIYFFSLKNVENQNLKAQKNNPKINSFEKLKVEKPVETNLASSELEISNQLNQSEVKESLQEEKILNNSSTTLQISKNTMDRSFINKVENRDIKFNDFEESKRTLASAVDINEVADYYEQTNESLTSESNFLSPKELLASIFKKKVLKSESKGTDVELEDFNNVLASLTNDKIQINPTDDHSRLISIQTKNFSFEKKIRN